MTLSPNVDNRPSGWATARFEDVVEILDHIRVPVNAEARSQRLGSVPYFGATGQVGTIDDYLFDEELVLLGEDGAPFLDPSKPKAYLIRGKSWVNNHAHVLRARTEVLNSFLLHQLNQIDFHPYVSGTTRLKLPQGPMRTILLQIPPLAEQRRIVAEIERHFSRLDAAVAALERARARLKRYRASTLEAACNGNLVPIESDIFIQLNLEYESGRDLAKRLGAKPSGVVVEEPYELPSGWTWLAFGELVQRSEYGTSNKCDYDGIGPPVLRIPNIVRGAIDLTDMKRTIQPLAIDDESRLTQGDLLMCRTNGSVTLIGRTAVVRRPMSSAHSFASYLLRFRFREREILPVWLHFYLASPSGRTFIERHAASSAGQHNISLSLMHRMPVPIPPLAEQKRIVAEIEKQISVADQMEAAVTSALRRADQLRQSILKRAFEGLLVPQDPTDEPASVLLERIRSERENNGVSVRASGKPRTLNGPVRRRRVEDDEPPVKIPTFPARRAVAELPAEYQQTSFTEESRR